MVDPTSDLGEDIDEEDAPTCATCGESIVNESTHRVLTWIQAGTVQATHFCDESCRAEWDDEPAE